MFVKSSANVQRQKLKHSNSETRRDSQHEAEAAAPAQRHRVNRLIYTQTGCLSWTYLVWHGAFLSKVLDVGGHQVLNCEGKKSLWLAIPGLTTREINPSCSPVLMSAARKSRTKSSSSPGHIPSLNTTMLWRYIRVADSNWVASPTHQTLEANFVFSI